jgi:NO-binding membrane sensor protein with MHYT domain
LCCLLGFVIGGLPRPRFAPELGGLVIGSGVVMTCFIALGSWHFPGVTYFNPAGLAITVMLGFGMASLALNRAYRPATRWSRQGAAIIFAIMICAIHGTLSASLTLAIDPSDTLAAGWHTVRPLDLVLVAAMLLATGAAASAVAP